ncbi:MAG TPA: TonB-dependent receptor [Bryobacteraceae bacterium]|nr:TonB-dependent receptor [Bryobacteraceae bacterium]
MKITRVNIGLAVLFLAGATAVYSQINRGTVEGIVSDSQGAIISGVQVEITSVDTNVSSRVVTNDTGYYRVVDLVPGKYRARFSFAGFSTIDMTDIDVPAGKVTRVDTQMRVDATRQTVEVKAEAPLVESGAANFSTTIETRAIQDIPLQGRDLQQLTFLIPGVNNVGGPPGSNFGFDSAFGTFPDPSNALGSNIAVNGGQGGANGWYLDGNLNLSNFAENVVINPTPDAVQEFQAITSGLGAEYSRTGGAVFSVVLKSGTNAFHGNAYEFLRNDATNARNPFTSVDELGNLVKSRQLRFNNFGGTLGGPVIIPHLYNGKDKTFFFFSMDKTILHLLGNQVFSVPTARMRNGDFSEDPNVANYGIFDPYTTVGPDANGLFTRQPLQNPDGSVATKIPANRLDPTAMFFINSFPLPNYNSPLSGCPMGKDGFAICSNYIGAVGTSQDPLKVSLKMDHAWSEKSRYFVEWLYSPVPYRNYRVPWTGASFPFQFVGFGSTYPVDFTSTIIALGNTYSITPTLINEFRASFSRQFMSTHPAHPYPDSITDQTAVQKVLAADRIPEDPYFPVPNFYINGPGGGAMSFGPTPWVNMNTGAEAYTILDNITRVLGKHTIKTGFTYRLEHSIYESGFPTGFGFTGVLTQDPNTGLGGNGLAQFMLGAASTNGRDSYTGVMWTPYERFRYWGFYVQDDYRVTQRLTLNIGLRYDINGYFRVRTGNGTNFCLGCSNSYTGLPGEVTFEGGPHFPKGDIAPAHKNSIGPRFHFSYTPFSDRKTIIRGGYSIFYSNSLTEINSPGQAAANAPGWNQEFDWQGSFYPNQCAPLSGQCVAFPLSDTTTDKANLTTPPRPTTFPAQQKNPLYAPLLIQFFTPPTRDPTIQMWDFEVEHELPSNMMVSVGYVGNHGTHLVGEAFRQFNFVHTKDVLKYRTTLDALVPISNYFSGQTLTALQQIYGGSQTQLRNLIDDYPAFGTVQDNTGFEGTSIYHGLNTRVQKRLSHGLDFIAAYTFSKKITNAEVANMATMLVDPLHWTKAANVGGRLGAIGGIYGGGFQDRDNKNADRAIAADDIAHMFNLASSYELPVGKGKPFLNQGGVVDAVLGGWRLTGNFNAQSGLPLGVGCPGNQITGRCNLVGDPMFKGGRSKAQRIADWINPAAFQPPFGSDQTFWANYDPTDNRAWQFGNAGIRLPGLRSPGFWNVDTTLSKQFHFTEQKYFEFRWEVFNTLNHQNLAIPNTSFCLPPLPDGTTDLVHQAGCSFGRITNIQTDPRAMEFVLKYFF